MLGLFVVEVGHHEEYGTYCYTQIKPDVLVVICLSLFSMLQSISQ